jgi:hypothetical protein
LRGGNRVFDREYSFRGDHAEKVLKLTAQVNESPSVRIFQRNVDVYIVAPVVGLLHGRKGAFCGDTNKSTKIFPEQLLKEQTALKYFYQLVMLLDSAGETTVEERLEKAFRRYGTKEAEEDERLFDAYVLGGVDILYEKLIEGATTLEDYLRKTYEFMDEVNARYNEPAGKLSEDDLVALARV